MSGCCTRYGCDEFFGERFARRSARRFRRKGPDDTARRLADWLGTGDSVLEIGGGVGQVALTVARTGADATLVEVVPVYEPHARSLAAEAGVTFDFRLADIVSEPGAVASAELVALNKVVCCTPDGVRLAGVAAGLAERRLALSLPRATWPARLIVGAQNRLFRLLRRSFRVYLHPRQAIVGAVEDAGLRLTGEHEGRVWRSLVFERPAVVGT